MLGSGFLCIFAVWYSPLVMLAFPAAMAAFFVLGYRRTHLWECLWEAIISVVLTVPVLLMMVGSAKHAFPMLFLIVGMGSIVGGASLQVRWVHWARQHALQLAQETIQ